MKQKYHGTITSLKALVIKSGITGDWRADPTGEHTFRTPEGGILNWWRNGTIQFQGKPFARDLLERSLKHLLSVKPGSAKPGSTKPDIVKMVKRPSEQYASSQQYDSSGSFYVTPARRKRIKNALSELGLTMTLIGGSVYIMSEVEYDFYLSRISESKPEIHFQGF